ncbi:MAG: solute carrier family 26 protein [Proteobacteria bacterium]|nr:solute carrier family 26 protein [Pseudomonadota bacterium]
MIALLRKYLPLLGVVAGYRKDDLPSDLAAGLTTAVMLVPQAMAYAMLAGLPPIAGLYASVAPLALYALFGTSRQLAIGPVAMVSLLVASGVGDLAPAGTDAFIAHAVLLAAMVGVIQLGMGLVRAGFLVNFLAHPVISGFTAAAAIIIGFSQLEHLLGVDLARTHHVHKIFAQALEELGAVNVATVVLSVASGTLLIALKRWQPLFPRALAVVVLGSLGVWIFDLAGRGVAIVGEVPGGFPLPGLPAFEWAAVQKLAPVAAAIALVGFMESISVAKAFARRKRHQVGRAQGYSIDANQELVALGMANIGGALFSAYPVTGGFSRTAVNAQAGARSTLAGLVTAAVVALTLLFLTPLFTYLPKAVLAAIIVTAVLDLVDIAEVVHLWRVKRSDLALLLITFLATLALGIEQGILIGVTASLLWFIVRSTHPHIAVLGRIPGTRVYRNVARHSDAETVPGTLIVRMDASFYFGNVTFLTDTLHQLEADLGPLNTVILDASAINNLDSSADAALRDLLSDYKARDITFLLARVKGPVKDVLERSGFIDHIGRHALADDVADAVERAGGGDPRRGGIGQAAPPRPSA